MPGDLKFSFGWKDEYATVANQWNRALAAGERNKLDTFIDLILDDDADLMDAHHKAFFGDAASTQLFREQLSKVADNWFGEEPMWFRDCTLTVDQIHQVMRWSRVWTAELLLAGGGPVEFWIRCGHPRFRTVITWGGDVVQDPPVPGQRWEPKDVRGPIRVWVYTPLNCGYGPRGVAVSPESRALLAELGARPRKDGITGQELWKLVHGFPGNRTIFVGTELAVEGREVGAERPPVAELDVKAISGFVEPPEEGLYIDSAYSTSYGAPVQGGVVDYGKPLTRPAARTVRGIEVSWKGAEPGRFLIHDCDRREARA